MNKRAAFTALLLLLPLPAPAAGANYHVTATYVLGGNGGWDYLSYDTSTKRLFISRSTSTKASPQTDAMEPSRFSTYKHSKRSLRLQRRRRTPTASRTIR